jgi:hypothetical protein
MRIKESNIATEPLEAVVIFYSANGKDAVTEWLKSNSRGIYSQIKNSNELFKVQELNDKKKRFNILVRISDDPSVYNMEAPLKKIKEFLLTHDIFDAGFTPIFAKDYDKSAALIEVHLSDLKMPKFLIYPPKEDKEKKEENNQLGLWS